MADFPMLRSHDFAYNDKFVFVSWTEGLVLLTVVQYMGCTTN